MSPRGFVAALLVGLLAGAALLAQSTAGPLFLSLRIVVTGTREEAERLRARLLSGEDFAALARRESIDPSASDGGLLGRLDVATLRPELRQALIGLGTGQLSPVVPVATGFAVLQPVPDAGNTPSAINPA